MNMNHSQLALINDQLSNNEHAHDEELVGMFVNAGIDEADARSAVSYRGDFFTKPSAYLVIEDNELVLKEHLTQRLCETLLGG